MKKIFFALFTTLALIGCDTGTTPNTPPTPPKPDTVIVKDSVKKVIKTSTNISYSSRMNISGKVLEKSSTGIVKGTFSAVACLESSGKCVRTNSSGQYSFSAITPKIAARSFNISDTTNTPETISRNLSPDTTIVLDTTSRNDTVYILKNVYVDRDTTYHDSVIIYNNTRILYEFPVTSWKSILPDAYVVQRNISGKILSGLYLKDLKTMEAVYWNVDSIALVIPLEVADNKLSYSGFIYQPYDDSSYKYQIKSNNIFVRAFDNTDSIFAITSVITYSERSGDLNGFEDILLGNVQKQPKSNSFTVIKNNDNVSKIIFGTPVKIFNNPNGYDLDSIFARALFIKYLYQDSNRTILKYSVNVNTVDICNMDSVDSIGYYFEADSEIVATITTGMFMKEPIKINKGKNLFKVKWYTMVPVPDGIKNQLSIQLVLNTGMIKNLKTIVWFIQ